MIVFAAMSRSTRLLFDDSGLLLPFGHVHEEWKVWMSGAAVGSNDRFFVHHGAKKTLVLVHFIGTASGAIAAERFKVMIVQRSDGSICRHAANEDETSSSDRRIRTRRHPLAHERLSFMLASASGHVASNSS